MNLKGHPPEGDISSPGANKKGGKGAVGGPVKAGAGVPEVSGLVVVMRQRRRSTTIPAPLMLLPLARPKEQSRQAGRRMQRPADQPAEAQRRQGGGGGGDGSSGKRKITSAGLRVSRFAICSRPFLKMI